MCTETFLHLPEEKRSRFLEAAWGEFTRVKFADASINQIVRNAGIPRGSFYQYFADKEDLFNYLLRDIQTQVVRAFGEQLRRSDGDLFQLPLALYDDITRRGERCPMLDRCFQVLQVNPGIDLQKLLSGVLQQEFPRELMERMRLERMVCRDPAYVRRVFLIVLGVLGRCVMDTLIQPERSEELRQELVGQLEIIQYGCLRWEDAPDLSQGGAHE